MAWRKKDIPQVLPTYELADEQQYVATGVNVRRWPLRVAGLVVGCLVGAGSYVLVRSWFEDQQVLRGLGESSITAFKVLALVFLGLYIALVSSIVDFLAYRRVMGKRKFREVNVPVVLLRDSDDALARFLGRAARQQGKVKAAADMTSEPVVRASLIVGAKDADETDVWDAIEMVRAVLASPGVRNATHPRH